MFISRYCTNLFSGQMDAISQWTGLEYFHLRGHSHTRQSRHCRSRFFLSKVKSVAVGSSGLLQHGIHVDDGSILNRIWRSPAITCTSACHVNVRSVYSTHCFWCFSMFCFFFKSKSRAINVDFVLWMEKCNYIDGHNEKLKIDHKSGWLYGDYPNERWKRLQQLLQSWVQDKWFIVNWWMDE